MNLKKVVKTNKGTIDVRCPICSRKITESIGFGTKLNVKCLKCEWEFTWHHVNSTRSYQKKIQNKMNKK